jgi:chromosome segregation ATPase
MAKRTVQAVLEFEVDIEDSIESIESLTKANKALREERNKLNLLTEQGRKRAQEINAVIDQNTAKIKTNVSAIEQQKINIGNYRSALDGVHPALGKVGQGLEAGTSGLKAMTMQALAFIATPLGAALAAIVAVFTLLKTALSQNDELMDKFENVTNAVGVVLEVVAARVGKLGEALIALAQGNFSEAINKTTEAFSGLGDEIENAVKQQQLFLDASRELEDSQRNLRIETARQENVIKSLVVAAKNRNLTFDEQEGKLRQALALEQNLVEQREDIARRDLLITARRLRADKEFQQQSNETFDQYIERLLSSSRLAPEELDKIVDKVEALEQARGSSLAFQEKVENSLAAVQEKRAAALEKQNAALAEQQALQRAIERQNENVDASTDDPLIDAFETRANVITNIEDRLQADLKKRRDAAALEEIQRAKASAALTAQKEKEKLAIISNTVGQAANLFEEDSEAYKGLATAQALINTYLAATAALASGSKINPVFGIISAAIAVANGLASVAKINGIEFAEGGWTGPGGKWDPVGIVHADEYVTPKRVKNLPQAQPHIAALEQMRLRGYADGGLVTNSISQPVNDQFALANVIKNLPPAELSVKEVTKVQKRIRVKESISKR